MRKFIKTTAAVILLLLSFVILVDAYACPEEKSSEAGPPVECCVQCCPRHHLAPPSVNSEQALSQAFFERCLLMELSPYSILLPDSVFHPPRA